MLEVHFAIPSDQGHLYSPKAGTGLPLRAHHHTCVCPQRNILRSSDSLKEEKLMKNIYINKGIKQFNCKLSYSLDLNQHVQNLTLVYIFRGFDMEAWSRRIAYNTYCRSQHFTTSENAPLQDVGMDKNAKISFRKITTSASVLAM